MKLKLNDFLELEISISVKVVQVCIGHLEAQPSSVYTKPQSGCSVTGLYHRMYAQLFLMNINAVVYGVLTLH